MFLCENISKVLSVWEISTGGEPGPPSTSWPCSLEGLAAKNLRFPHGSPIDTPSQEGHTPAWTPEKENGPKGCEIRPSIYYFIYHAATQLVEKRYPHSTTSLCLCFYVGHRAESSPENLPGKIWKPQLRIVDPTFLHKLSHERRGEAMGFKTCECPNFGIS